MAAPTLTDSQVRAIMITERVNSCVSILAITFVFTTYTFCPAFQKPINRLIFFATWGNLGFLIACLISVDGYKDALDPYSISPLCRFQSFVVQMFNDVDVYWAACMAFNVYLAFFRGWSIDQLRALEIRYFFLTYGLSFIPAFTLLFVKGEGGVSIYGPATIWCWISREYDWLRLVVVYAIIWIALSFSLVVYIAAARVIWKKRAQLDGFLNPWNESPFTTVTTEVIITSESRGADDLVMVENPAIDLGDGPVTDDKRQYSINIDAPAIQQKRGLPAAINVRSVTRDVASKEVNAESWLYARVAFLFFLALALNWIPASVFRIRDVMNPGDNNFVFGYIACFIFPLQGFWNAVVYIITSRTACKQLWNDIRRKRYSIAEIGTMRPSRTSYSKRSELKSWHTDEEALRSDIGMSKEVLSFKSSRTQLRSGSQEDVPPMPSHIGDRRSTEADHHEPIDLSIYR